jgi:hypothetical protein
MIARIDADIVAYKGLTVCEGFFAQMRACENYLQSILDFLEPTSYEMVLSGSNNFRKALYPEYKAHRPPRPPNLYDIRQYFIKYHPTVVTEGQEADDYLASMQDENSIICSSDKDMLTIPGNHLRIMPKSWEQIYVSEEYADFRFFLQMCTGDSADNVPGLPNPAKSHWTKPPCFTEPTATEILKDKSKAEMQSTVIGLYQQVYGDDWFERYDLTASLLYLRRGEGSNYTEKYL